MNLISSVWSPMFFVGRKDVFFCGRGWLYASQVCCDTPPFLGKDIPILNFFFCRGGGGAAV